MIHLYKWIVLAIKFDKELPVHWISIIVIVAPRKLVYNV